MLFPRLCTGQIKASTPTLPPPPGTRTSEDCLIQIPTPLRQNCVPMPYPTLPYPTLP